MKFFSLFSLTLCTLLTSSFVSALDPVTASVAAGTVVVTSILIRSYDAISCLFTECCTANWIPKNITGLAKTLEKKLYGQHLVIDSVVKNLQSHLRAKNPTKALVLSFHGWTGGGKNYVSKMIAEHLFKLGMRSKYVHFFSATMHFPHIKNMETYKDQLRDWIKGNVTLCGQSLFIFDEIEKMPGSLLDTIKPYLDHHDQINGVDYRNSIFIFLSNVGGEAINVITQDHWVNGKRREDLRLKDLEDVLAKQSYNDEGGLRGSALIDRSLVSVFVPFLPLERAHVRLCIRDDLVSKDHPIVDRIIDQVMDELSFFPADTKLYSKKGCKGVSDKVNLIMEEVA